MISNNLLREKVLQKLLVDDFSNEDNTLLSSVCVLDNLKKISGKRLPYLDVKFLRGQSEGTYKEDGFEVNTGDLIILVDGENSGEIFEIPCQGYMGSTFKKLKLSDEVIRKYIMYFIALNKELLKGNKTGSAIPHLNKKLFASLKLHVPNKELQSEIVDKIDNIFELIDKNEKNDQEKENLKKVLKEKILNNAIHGCLVKNDESLIPVDVEVITDDVPFAIPSNWNWSCFGKMADKITDGTHSTPKYCESGIPFLSVKDMSDGKLHFDNCKYISEEEHNVLYKRCDPKRDDLLITKVGTTGVPVIVDVDFEFSLFVSVALLRFNQEKFINKYLKYVVESRFVQNIIDENTKGMANKNWVIKKIAETPIPVPPLEEQKRIVEKIENIFELIEQL